MRYLRLKFRHFGVPWSDAPGGMMRSVVKHVIGSVGKYILTLSLIIDYKFKSY